MKKLLALIFLAAVVLFVSRCNRLHGKSFIPDLPGYSSDTRQSVILKRPLREISGIDYLGPDKLLAINDEAGKLFFLNPANGIYTSHEFGKKDDYEDVVRAGDYYYVMNSKGHLFEVRSLDNKLMATYTHDFGKFMEFESLCYDRANQQLLLICKECGKHQNSINAYRFNLTTKQFVPGIGFSISWSHIRGLMKDNSIECKPSAAAINPMNGKIYIIASLGKVLLQADASGALEAAYGLNPDHFPQPEGITFSPTGDLYIANEGMQGKATLLKYTFLP